MIYLLCFEPWGTFWLKKPSPPPCTADVIINPTHSTGAEFRLMKTLVWFEIMQNEDGNTTVVDSASELLFFVPFRYNKVLNLELYWESTLKCCMKMFFSTITQNPAKIVIY